MDNPFWHNLYLSHRESPACPSPAEVATFFSDLLGTLFADFNHQTFSSEQEFESHIQKLKKALSRILCDNADKSEAERNSLADEFFKALPALYVKINEDVTAMFE